MLSKLQERSKAREQQSLATKKESDVQGAKTSEPSDVGKTKRKPEQQKKEKTQLTKKRKESIKEQDVDADADDIAAERAGLSTRKKKKKKDKKANVVQEDEQHSGSCDYACVNLPGKQIPFSKLCVCLLIFLKSPLEQ